MKVYIALIDMYYDCFKIEIIGVFDNKNKAENKINEYMKDRKYLALHETRIEEWEIK